MCWVALIMSTDSNLGKVFVRTHDLKHTVPFLCLKTQFPKLVSQYLQLLSENSQNYNENVDENVSILYFFQRILASHKQHNCCILHY